MRKEKAVYGVKGMLNIPNMGQQVIPFLTPVPLRRTFKPLFSKFPVITIQMLNSQIIFLMPTSVVSLTPTHNVPGYGTSLGCTTKNTFVILCVIG